jgi:anti-sigma B factor antagonist
VAELTRTLADDGVVIIEIGGEFDLEDAEQAWDLIADSIDGQPLVLDLERCDFMDSSGVRVLIQAHDRTRQSGTPFAVAGSGPQVRRLFELTGLIDALPIFDERETALRHLAGR